MTTGEEQMVARREALKDHPDVIAHSAAALSEGLCASCHGPAKRVAEEKLPDSLKANWAPHGWLFCAECRVHWSITDARSHSWWVQAPHPWHSHD